MCNIEWHITPIPATAPASVREVIVSVELDGGALVEHFHIDLDFTVPALVTIATGTLVFIQ